MKESIKLSGQSGLAIAASIEGASDGMPVILAHGGAVRTTADLHVDFHRPATPGSQRKIGRVVKLGKQLSVAETRIEESAQRRLASGRAAYVG